MFYRLIAFKSTICFATLIVRKITKPYAVLPSMILENEGHFEGHKRSKSKYCQNIVSQQWLRGRASDSRLREPGFESYASVLKHWASSFHCTLLQFTQLYKRVVDMCTSSLRALIVAYDWMLPREAERCLSEQVCKGSKV